MRVRWETRRRHDSPRLLALDRSIHAGEHPSTLCEKEIVVKEHLRTPFLVSFHSMLLARLLVSSNPDSLNFDARPP